MKGSRLPPLVSGVAVISAVAAIGAGFFLPSEFLFVGVSRPLAVTLVGMAPVVLVAIGVGAVIVYRHIFPKSGARRAPKRMRGKVNR